MDMVPFAEQTVDCKHWARKEGPRVQSADTVRAIEEVYIPGIPYINAFVEGITAETALLYAKTRSYRADGPYAAVLSNNAQGTDYYKLAMDNFPILYVVVPKGRPMEEGADHRSHTSMLI